MGENTTHEKAHKSHSSFFLRKRFIIPILILVVLGVTASIYYSPLKIWYREARQERVLREQLRAVKEYNAQLAEEVSSLETTEGTADYARSVLGLVEKGDHKVVILQGGKPLEAKKNTREKTIEDISETAKPFGSWTDFLDALFGVK